MMPSNVSHSIPVINPISHGTPISLLAASFQSSAPEVDFSSCSFLVFFLLLVRFWRLQGCWGCIQGCRSIQAAYWRQPPCTWTRQMSTALLPCKHGQPWHKPSMMQPSVCPTFRYGCPTYTLHPPSLEVLQSGSRFH